MPAIMKLCSAYHKVTKVLRRLDFPGLVSFQCFICLTCFRRFSFFHLVPWFKSGQPQKKMKRKKKNKMTSPYGKPMMFKV
jgi:hypothetical protein